MAKYCSNKELYNEILISKQNGKLTDKAFDMLYKMVLEISKKLRYEDYEDKKDCTQSAIEDVLRYWNGFNPELSDNAFSYFTQLIKNGLAKGWKKLHPLGKDELINLSKFYSITDNNDSSF